MAGQPVPTEGVVRQAFYSYKVPVGEPTAVMTFTDAGDINNRGLDEDRVIVELADLKLTEFELRLGEMIVSVTSVFETEVLPSDQLHLKLLPLTHCLFCHPDTPEAFLKDAQSLGVPVVAVKAFEAPDDTGASLIIARKVPGLVAQASEGFGAFLFPSRFERVRLQGASKNSAWDRLLRDDLLGDE